MGRSPLSRKPLRNPGQSLDEEIDRLLNDRLLGYFFLAGTFWVCAWMEWFAKVMEMPRRPALYVVAAICFTGLLAFRAYQVRRKLQRIRQGRDGEREVAELLQDLIKTGASVIHDIPGEGFNIDHVVISTRGIFVIETKTWSKSNASSRIDFDGRQIRVSGKTPMRDPIQQCRAASAWLRDLLQTSTGKYLAVRAVVVFPGWWVEHSSGARDSDVWVLNPKQLAGWMAQKSEIMATSDAAMAAFHLQQYVRSQ
jgi:hypothetical protein